MPTPEPSSLNNLPTSSPRQEIALAWKRASFNGLDPGMEVADPPVSVPESPAQPSLQHAAGPVLTRLAEDLADSRFSVLLADETARIVDRKTSPRTPFSLLERVKAVPGAQYSEDLSGTNSLATPFETRHPIAVVGEEHFLESLRAFACYGAPIIHPVTRRLVGVLDITGPSDDATALLPPLVMRAVSDIRSRLLDSSREEEKRLLQAFQTTTSQRRSTAVVAHSRDLVLANDAAHDLLTPTDLAFLRNGLAEAATEDDALHLLHLPSGVVAEVRVRTVSNDRGGVILEIRKTGDNRTETDTPRQSPAYRHSSVEILITGEPGTGRTTRALERASDISDTAGAPEPFIINCADATGTSAPLSRASLAWQPGQTLVVDDVHLLPDPAAVVLRSALQRTPTDVVFTALATTLLTPAQRALVSTAVDTEEMPALRDAGARFPTIVDTILATVTGTEPPGPRDTQAGHSALRVAPSALAVLAGQEWPGNLTELRTVLTAAAHGRTRADISLTDIPQSHRLPPAQNLTRLERAERATIRAALADAGGNKKAAADDLGIGRTTLYQRLRYFDLS